MLYTTKTLTRDGITFTATFRDGGEAGYRVTEFTLQVAGQSIDAMRAYPSFWTEAARDAQFIKDHPQLSMVADEVYEKGKEVHSEVETVRREVA